MNYCEQVLRTKSVKKIINDEYMKIKKTHRNLPANYYRDYKKGFRQGFLRTCKNKNFKNRSIRMKGSGASISKETINMPNNYKAFTSTDELINAVKTYFQTETRNGVIHIYGIISDWNTSQLTDMSHTFSGIKPIPGDDLIVLNWDTRNVRSMAFMFNKCSLNFKINFTNTINVTNMERMFSSATKFNQPLPKSFNTSKVTDMQYMFCEATEFNQPLPKSFNTSNVTDMCGMFMGATNFNQPLPELFNTSKVEDMSYMFHAATNYNQPFPKAFKTSNVTDMGGMFQSATNFNQPLEFDTSNVTNMSDMFYLATNYNQPLKFDTSNVTNMSLMFYFATNFNQPLEFDTNNVTNMRSMFYGASKFNQPLEFDTNNVTDMSAMFCKATNFNQPINFDTSNVFDMAWMFKFATSFNQPIFFITNISHNSKIMEIFSYTTNLQSPIYIKVKYNIHDIKPKHLFNDSKIMNNIDYIEIKNDTISVLSGEKHILAYAMTEYDKQHSLATGNHRQYAEQILDLQELDTYLPKW
jgi:hypothetical protein